MTELLIIGFDGMDYFMTKRTIRDYHFKNLKPILKKQLTKETVTGPSWASFYTGLDKEVHGVIDGWGRDNGESNTFQDIQDHAFWNIVKEAGFSVYVDNLPITPEGFPFCSSEENDIVNWVYQPIKGGSGKWRPVIREMDFKEVLSKVRMHSFNLIEKVRNHDLIFIQFSFLDRIGHVFTFKNEEITMKSYSLAYELIDRLFGLTTPRYLIVTSDHGFFRRGTSHVGADCAVAILNDRSHQFFSNNQVYVPISVSHNWKYFYKSLIYPALRNLSFATILPYVFHFKYVKQSDIFDEILKMFNIDFKKAEQRTPKMKKLERIFSAQEKEDIKRRLQRLGYL